MLSRANGADESNYLWIGPALSYQVGNYNICFEAGQHPEPVGGDLVKLLSTPHHFLQRLHRMFTPRWLRTGGIRKYEVITDPAASLLARSWSCLCKILLKKTREIQAGNPGNCLSKLPHLKANTRNFKRRYI